MLVKQTCTSICKYVSEFAFGITKCQDADGLMDATRDIFFNLYTFTPDDCDWICPDTIVITDVNDGDDDDFEEYTCIELEEEPTVTDDCTPPFLTLYPY